MEPFGEQLRRAREARNLTLKDAENAVKIREDFLREFEASNFDFPLPEIYRQGFLRVYAEFLDLNAEPWLEQLAGRREERSPLPEGEEQDESAQGSGGGWASWLWARCRSRRWQFGALALLLAVPLLFSLLRSPSGADREWAELLQGEAAETVVLAPQPAKKLTLLASDSVQVLVRTKDSKKKIFSAFLKKGSAEVVEYGESVQISYSEGNALSVRTDSGETVRPRKAGVGWLEIAYQ
ncbi:MAG: helix-turn-helix domain-containing protein [Puniceicoccales bacterium]|jgi:transcriptional regulator with XRE-family HTH domain|nr:helix-turn-helix domain-containing protein [Puniceicoccales bacterium]